MLYNPFHFITFPVWKIKQPMSNETKKKLEKLAAQQFINIYNGKIGSSYEIYEISEAPDIRCVDIDTGLKFDLEITGHENIKGDYKKFVDNLELGIPQMENFPFGNSLGQRGKHENIIKILVNLIEEKLLAKYQGTPTALIIWRTTKIWSCSQLENALAREVNELLIGKKDHYPKGIWLFCIQDKTSQTDILNLSTLKPPRLLSIEPPNY